MVRPLLISDILDIKMYLFKLKRQICVSEKNFGGAKNLLFSSIPFLYYFLPAVLLCYFAAPKKLKNAVLFVFSLVFYAWGEPVYVFLMAASITLAWAFGLSSENAVAAFNTVCGGEATVYTR